MVSDSETLALFAGNANPALAHEIARSSGCCTAKVKVAERGQTVDELLLQEAGRIAGPPAPEKGDFPLLYSEVLKEPVPPMTGFTLFAEPAAVMLRGQSSVMITRPWPVFAPERLFWLVPELNEPPPPLTT